MRHAYGMWRAVLGVSAAVTLGLLVYLILRGLS